MNNFEFENALNQIINGATARGDKQTVVWAKVIQSGWRRCKTGTQKQAFRREAERQFNKHLVPVQEVANELANGNANETANENANADGGGTDLATTNESTE